MTAPFLKWVGGKTQILNAILESIPSDINNYHEIFLGGGSVLFGILTLFKNKQINLRGDVYAYDINKTLINTYKCIQDNPDNLYENILIHINNYLNCPSLNGNRKPVNMNEALSSKESYYYWIRKEFNSLTVSNPEEMFVKSAMFIFLNKTCFRGLYRESKNGFNVPFGNYVNPEVVNLSHLREVSALIEGVNFVCLDFEQSLTNINEDDFVYLDPPYAPENEKSFTQYSIEDFTLDKHNKLFDMVKKISSSFLMSNANVDLVNTNFPSDKYNVKTILCKRTINSKNPGIKTLEVLISNF